MTKSEKKKTLVVGGSIKPERYSNIAMRKLLMFDHPVVSIGLREGQVRDIEIQTGFPELTDIHTITLYVGPQNQPQYYDYLLALNPKRIVFNPGTENIEFREMAEQKGIETIYHCTLIMLDEGIF